MIITDATLTSGCIQFFFVDNFHRRQQKVHLIYSIVMGLLYLMNILSKHVAKAGGLCANIIHLNRRVYSPAEGGGGIWRKAFEVITCFYFLLSTTNRNEMISHHDRWGKSLPNACWVIPLFLLSFQTPHAATELDTEDNIQFHSKSHSRLVFSPLGGVGDSAP